MPRLVVKTTIFSPTLKPMAPIAPETSTASSIRFFCENIELANEAEKNADKRVLLTDIFLDDANDLMGLIRSLRRRYLADNNNAAAAKTDKLRTRTLAQRDTAFESCDYFLMAILMSAWEATRKELKAEHEHAING